MPGDVFYVTATDGARTWAGAFHYNDLDALVERLETMSRATPQLAVSACVNPVKTELLSRVPFSSGAPAAVATDVREWRWLPVVIRGDATQALDLATRMSSTLSAEGWSAPVIVRSPGGAVLLYRVRLRTDPDDADLVRRCQQTLAARFLTQRAEVTLDGCAVELATGVPGLGGRETRWRVERAPARLDLVARDLLTAGRAPEVQAPASWDHDAFESGLELLEMQLAAPPGSAARRDVLEFGDSPAPAPGPPVPAPAPLPVAAARAVMAVRSVVVPMSTRLPVTDFGEAFDRYRGQHREPGARLGTSFPDVDRLAGRLRGLVLLEGGAGEGRSTMALQIAAQALLTHGAEGVVVTIASTTLSRQDVTDRLVSQVARLPLDALNHGHARHRVHEQDGLRLDAKERKQLKDALAKLAAAQSRLFIVDPEWLTQVTTGARARDGVAGLMADAKRSLGARRSLCIIDDLDGLRALAPEVDCVAELQHVARTHQEDVVLVVTTGAGPDGLRQHASLRLTLSRAVGDPRPGMEPMRLSVSTRRGEAADGHVPLRFFFREHRFEVEP